MKSRASKQKSAGFSDQSKCGRGNQVDAPVISAPTMYTDPWRRNAYGAVSQAEPLKFPSNSSSMECPNGSDSNDVQSLSGDGGLNEEDDCNYKGSQATTSRSVETFRQDSSEVAHMSSAMPTAHGQHLAVAQAPELVGHYIACVPNAYQDPYYAGMMGVYGQQHSAHFPYVGMPHERSVLPLDMSQEPVYVNAKQYEGIMRRRKARAKAELERKAVKDRKPYLHESRHRHAMRRPRASGGRFAKKTDVEPSHAAEEHNSDSEPHPTDSA